MTAKERKQLKTAVDAAPFRKNWRQRIGRKGSLFRRRKSKSKSESKQLKNEQKENLERRQTSKTSIASDADSSLMQKVAEKNEQQYIAPAPLPLRGVLKRPEMVDRERSSAVLSFEQQSLIVDRSNSGSRARNSPPRKRPSVTQKIGSAFASVRFAGSIIAQDTIREISRMKKEVSVRTLLNEEIQRVKTKRGLIFPEMLSAWDTFWIGLLLLFVLSVIPGIFRFAARSFPNNWEATGESVTFEDVNVKMALYKSAGYGIITPLSRPMPFYFLFHVLFGGFASLLLWWLFTTGRVMRWRLADGTVDYDSAEDLHKICALLSAISWTAIIVTGGMTIPLLHPTLQVANYAELGGVLALFVITLLSAYFRQWVFHRLAAWGLIYSAVAAVFVCVSGRTLQAWSGLSTFEIKAIGYSVAFFTPIFGLTRDVLKELSKLRNDSLVNELEQIGRKKGAELKKSKINFVAEARPFKAARGDRLRQVSLWKHVMGAEPIDVYQSRRFSSIGPIRNSSSSNGIGESFLRQLDELDELDEYASSLGEIERSWMYGQSA